MNNITLYLFFCNVKKELFSFLKFNVFHFIKCNPGIYFLYILIIWWLFLFFCCICNIFMIKIFIHSYINIDWSLFMEITKTDLFYNISEQQQAEMMHCFKTYTRTYKSGEVICFYDDNNIGVGIIESGSARVIHFLLTGPRLFLSNYVVVIFSVSFFITMPVLKTFLLKLHVTALFVLLIMNTL